MYVCVKYVVFFKHKSRGMSSRSRRIRVRLHVCIKYVLTLVFGHIIYNFDLNATYTRGYDYDVFFSTVIKIYVYVIT